MADGLAARTIAEELVAQISKEDVENAFDEIDKAGIAPRRGSRRFCAQHGGRHYPPKLAVAIAAAYSVSDDFNADDMLQAADFSSTTALGHLTKLGFNIVACRCGGGKRAPRHGTAFKRAVVNRLIVRGSGQFDPRAAKRCLLATLAEMKRAQLSCEVLMTPAHFLSVFIPYHLSEAEQELQDNSIRRVAIRVEAYLTKMLVAMYKAWRPEIARFVTLGVEALLPNYTRAELIGTLDTIHGRVTQWTGTIHRPRATTPPFSISDHENRLQVLGDTRCLILGANDLKAFQRDADLRDDRLGDEWTELAASVRSFRPSALLHHSIFPIYKAGTDIPRNGSFASPHTYAMSFCYPMRRQHKVRDMSSILNSTKSPGVADVIWFRNRALTHG